MTGINYPVWLKKINGPYCRPLRSQETYLDFLLFFCKYSSMAIVIDGAVLVGASIFKVKPASLTALLVVGPNAPITVLFCLNSGKFLKSDAIPDGLKKISILYLFMSMCDKSLARVL